MTAVRVCVVGDSIALGTGDPQMLGWPGRLAAAEVLRGHDVTLYNLGIRADTSRQVAARWRAECAARLPDAFEGLVVFTFGINDTACEADGSLRVPPDESLALARRIVGEARDWKPLLWLGPTPIDETRMPISILGSPPRDFRNDRIRAASAQQAHEAADLGVPYLDLHAQLASDPGWSAALAAGDGVHPAAEGYALLAAVVGAWPPWRRRLDR